MSLQYLKTAVAENDSEKLIRYVRLHLGDGNEAAGRKEIDKAWIIFAELDLKAIDKERMTLDVTGHYRRPDLFDLRII